ncbi:Ubiquitin carboxyl-terminal hydrolase cyk-3 [Caenorhabditis elegans]|uniref:Isoform a of Ubiquitin carboxyl-terminal hydrolase cyk-3 n=1 Tax=Caenorhabditis elegans TaxID=6239 RepID=Q8WT44-2|nr:Ubiquitin carboxyl-terminal hydrolase cyk-3 [Caenorhabditis elegans]AAL79016.1 ubiquitin c-terminal hydrolase [Caenorhabditis elegans]CCD70947.1 Ubiquitin carboxyl-terminal hydrolase cyk-3 [Caenorhabditis elegans]|eukprot:NP_498311.2 Ubiquitin carboxyl-terminal hydrolase cyk-3 [Caenorhabditis elegans]
MGNTLTGRSNAIAPIISAEDAKTYISDEEYRRIRQAFQRFKNGCINYDEFCYHVLGGAQIPEEKRRLLFSFFSHGAETISFDNLLSSLVGLCRVEEVQSRFIEEYHEFASWGLSPPKLTIPLNDSYISFYEVMSYVTHLSVNEVIELEKVFATISDRAVCKLNEEKWKQALGGCFPDSYAERLFAVFDENRDGQIDFRELVCTLSALCRGPLPGRISQLARIWDVDCDKLLSDEELSNMYKDLNVPEEHQTVTKSSNGKSALVDFGIWAQENEKYVNEYYSMALQIGHICLGLRPESRKMELQIVNEFEKRASELPLSEWNIVASGWHAELRSFLEADKNPNPIDNSGIKGTREDSWTSKVACISAESARLKPDLIPSDYIRVPVPLWRAWLRWHGCALTVDSQFTRKYLDGEFFEDNKPALELYPLEILLLGHDRKKSQDGTENTPRSLTSWACAQVSRSMTVDELLALCKTELRLGDGDARLWQVVKENEEGNVLLDDGAQNLHQLYSSLGKTKKVNKMKLLLEVRERGTGVWPEELRASLSGKQITAASTLSSNAQLSGRPGAVGLVNYGNFCYRNAGIQCLARVSPLTQYFLDEDNLDAIKRGNLRRGDAAETTIEYAKLLREMWAAKKKNIAPNDFNDAIRLSSDMFECSEQHDCQEFVAFLLDQLHTSMYESNKSLHPSPEESEGTDSNKLSDSSKKKEADKEEADEEKAERSWTEYEKQNESLVTQLFTGQLRSRLICRTCQSSSSVFEPFTSLSLPIGFEDVDLYQVIVVHRDGRIPRRYGFRLSRDSKVGNLREVVAVSSGISMSHLTIQCMSSKGTLMSRSPNHRSSNLRDELPLSSFPSGARLYALELPESTGEDQWRVAMHRKLQYNHEPYILGSTAGFIVSRFGLPLIVGLDEEVTGKKLYEDVMYQMHRFMEHSVNSSSSRAHDPCEDENSGYPFTLCLVDPNYEWCGQCPALRFCRGCPIRPDESKVFIPANCPIAVDWLPIALYLRYNHSQEQACEDDPSVAETWSRHFAPSSLEHCIEKFSCPETLDAAIQCDRCEKKTMRDKVMTIWKLPKYLIIHLKRFEFLREQGRMGKCKRTVNFPLKHFDPAPFVDKPDGNTYECIALANHYGQLSCGHFIAYAKSNEDKWLLLNDCSVREVSEEEVDKQGAYLLFYERKDVK